MAFPTLGSCGPRSRRRLDPLDPELLLIKRSGRASPRSARAVVRYERAVTNEPKVLSFVDLGAAYANLGVVRLEQRRGPEAMAAFRSALEHTNSPLDRRRLTHNLALATLLSGDAAEAERLLEEESRRPDALPEALVLRARILGVLGRRADAELLLGQQ
jgi:Tfp pilus assembly protein PilF